jgi:LAS superfamily LD-carboxypeptidase LdcB
MEVSSCFVVLILVLLLVGGLCLVCVQTEHEEYTPQQKQREGTSDTGSRARSNPLLRRQGDPQARARYQRMQQVSAAYLHAVYQLTHGERP